MIIPDTFSIMSEYIADISSYCRLFLKK